jgi:uncharacterized protein
MDQESRPPEGHSGEPQPAAPPVRFDPVAEGERVVAVDTLRGVALLGILAMNVYAFAMPLAAYANPKVYGGDRGLDLVTWFATHVLFDQKFMTIFSMLFGAGLVLMAVRAEARGARFAGTYYRRLLWLIVIGMLHAYLLWVGDILFAYAICGLMLYPMRKLKPRTLLVVGSALLVIGMAASTALGLLIGWVRDTAVAAQQVLDAGEDPTAFQSEMLREWNEMRLELEPSEEQIAADLEAHRGGWAGIVVYRAPTVVEFQTIMMLFFTFWRAGGLMLVGMALMKLGVFSAARSTPFYTRLLAVGYGAGLPLVVLSAWVIHDHDFDAVFVFQGAGLINYVASILVALGHVSLVMLVCRSGALPALRGRLAAVGRTALSNYLLHSVVMTTVFYGYGLGLYGRFGRFGQMGLVLAVWLLQLAVSPVWLRRFRYGPAEWLWRSLTYLRLARMAR